MNKNIKISLSIILLVALMFVLIFYVGKSILPDLVGNTVINDSNPIDQTDTKLLDKKAPHFDLFDVNGDLIKLSNSTNIPVVLVFWATWNQESSDQIKIFDDYLLNQKAQSSLIDVRGIASLEDSGVVKSFIKRGKYNVLTLLDTTGDVSNHYNIKSLPTTYLIDKDGIVREIYSGVLSQEMIVDKVENLLK